MSIFLTNSTNFEIVQIWNEIFKLVSNSRFDAFKKLFFEMYPYFWEKQTINSEINNVCEIGSSAI